MTFTHIAAVPPTVRRPGDDRHRPLPDPWHVLQRRVGNTAVTRSLAAHTPMVQRDQPAASAAEEPLERQTSPRALRLLDRVLGLDEPAAPEARIRALISWKAVRGLAATPRLDDPTVHRIAVKMLDLDQAIPAIVFALDYCRLPPAIGDEAIDAPPRDGCVPGWLWPLPAPALTLVPEFIRLRPEVFDHAATAADDRDQRVFAQTPTLADAPRPAGDSTGSLHQELQERVQNALTPLLTDLPATARELIMMGALAAVDKGVSSFLDEGLKRARASGELREAVRTSFKATLRTRF